MNNIVKEIDSDVLSPSDFAVKIQTSIFEDFLDKLIDHIFKSDLQKHIKQYLRQLINNYINKYSETEDPQIIDILSNLKIQTIIIPYSTVNFDRTLYKVNEYISKKNYK